MQATSAHNSLAAGTRFDRYVVAGLAGRGAFAEVYRAFDPLQGQDVALKLLHADAGRDSALARRFRSEAALLKRLGHPHIVRLYRGGSAADRLFLALEFIDGVTLAEMTAQGRPLAVAEVARFLPGLCAAIDYLHFSGAIHRDIKPANVMLTSSGRVVLMDFGIARERDRTTLTQPGMLLGSPLTIAPEQVAGVTVGPAADVYALAALCYYLLTGTPLFSGSLEEVLHGHAALAPVPLRVRCPGLPDAVYDVVRAGLAKDPGKRPALASDFADAFADLRPPRTRTGYGPRLPAPDAMPTPSTMIGFAMRGVPARATGSGGDAAWNQATAANSIEPGRELGTENAVAPTISVRVSLGQPRRRCRSLGVLTVAATLLGAALSGGMLYRANHAGHPVPVLAAMSTSSLTRARAAIQGSSVPKGEPRAAEPSAPPLLASPQSADSTESAPPATPATEEASPVPTASPATPPVELPIADPRAIYEYLLLKPADEARLPGGLVPIGAGPSESGDDRRAMGVIGTVEVAITGPDLQDSLYYNVYGEAAGARRFFDNLTAANGARTNRRYDPVGFDVPATCLEQTVPSVNGGTVGESACDNVVGPVEILAVSIRDDSDQAGDSALAESLARAAVEYVEQVTRASSAH